MERMSERIDGRNISMHARREGCLNALLRITDRTNGTELNGFTIMTITNNRISGRFLGNFFFLYFFFIIFLPSWRRVGAGQEEREGTGDRRG